MSSPTLPATHENASLAESLASLSASKRTQILGRLTDAEVFALRYDWRFWGRRNQFAPPGDWLVWLVLAGRGWGKTRVGAEWAKEHMLTQPGCRVALVAGTFADARDTMVEGESGLLAIIPDYLLRGGNQATAWNRSMGELYLANGSTAKVYTAEKATQLRGPQSHFAWCDEAAKWKDAHLGVAEDSTWSNLMMGLRVGAHPQCVVTTTPKPNRLIKAILARDTTVVTRGTTYENLVNLAPPFREQIVSMYEGTRLGRQELMAELLEDVPGALWTLAQLDKLRVSSAPELRRIVVAIDPAGSTNEDSDETGIVACGIDAQDPPHGYVLADRSGKYSPDGWARAAAKLYHELDADHIVAETNYGGDMVKFTLRTVDPQIPVIVKTATRGKRVRAEPIAALDEQGRIHHVGRLDALEDQMANWLPDEPNEKSPDRMDARVWGFSELMLKRHYERKGEVA